MQLYKREITANIRKILKVHSYNRTLDAYVLDLEDGAQLKINPDLYCKYTPEEGEYFVQEGFHVFIIDEERLKNNYTKIEVKNDNL